MQGIFDSKFRHRNPQNHGINEWKNFHSLFRLLYKPLLEKEEM